MLFADFKKGETYHGFELLEKRFVKEVNAECLYFQHLKSGARLFKIVADDANKTFSIAFKTVPQSDAGTPHIMEHSVLNGSKNFPVKSPFDVLSKGSLNTFLNAMTGKEITIYPVASMNNKDYFNLMHVYLDAVFNPLIYDDPRILKQEGWHHELIDQDSAVVYKGVVYNEMKGAYSNPSRELTYQIDKHLFPESSYRFSSGGYPPSIPALTFEDFLDFHRRFYHPSNSYIFLYGDADLEKELAFIDAEYLTHYEQLDGRISIPIQKPFEEIREASAYYAVPEGSDTTNQSYLTLSFVADLSTNQTLYMALEILQEVLVNQESAPVRLALQETGIGREVRASLDDKKQNVFQIKVQNANPEDRDKFRDIVMKTLREVKEEGLDEEAVEGTLNRIEFRLREGDDAQKGLTYNFQGLTGWFFADDPFLSLEYEKPLADIKAKIKNGYLESVIQKYMLDNPHALVLVMQPKPGLEKENNASIDKELEEFKAGLSDAQAEALVNETRDLVAYQKREDTPEALATIPLLDIKDINPEAEWYDLTQMEVAGIPLLHHETFTNNVVYARLYYDMRVLPAELIPYSALLAEFLGSLNTENYTYGELDKALNLNTGGFSTFPDTYLEDRSDDKLIPKFIVESKSMNNKVEKMFELTGEIINNTKYADKERLKAVLTRHQSRLDASIKRNGLGYARTRLISYFSNEGMCNELTGGVTYYKFVTDLLNNFDAKAETIIANLGKIAAQLFTKENLIAAYTGSASDLQAFKDGLENLTQTLPGRKTDYQKWIFEFDKKNEGMLSASKVQYVLKGYDFKKLGYQWNGKMRVLNQVISRDWLQNQVRVIGGAYGGWSSFSPTGQVYFASYRDPNLKETLENYNATPEYLHNFEADEKDMTRYIIGTIARMDRPLTPSQKGELAVRRYFYKTTKEEIQKEREAVIATTAEDIKEMEKLVKDVLAQDAFCVYGNEQKINAEKEVFGTVIPLNE
jgi:Zn-dependent M16 (insulinase) family peptidase